MKNYRKRNICFECFDNIDNRVFEYSINNFGFPLCRDCQDELGDIIEDSTDEALNLYFALRERGVPAELEKDDGHKSIDIAVVEAKVNIEVDGMQHNFNPKQALSDLRRTYHSFRKGYLTLRIPNSLIRFHLQETADLITEFLNESNGKKYKYRY